MKSITYKIISDIHEARKMWELFSPHITIDDEWDFRYLWISPLDLKLNFIVGFDNETPIGLLPLQLNNNVSIGQKIFQAKEPFLEFFGGLDTDDNKIFLSKGYEDLEEKFLKQISKPAYLAPLVKPYSLKGNEATHYNDRFEISLDGLTDFNSYIDRFSGKIRRNLKSEMKNRLKESNIEIIDGTIDDLDLLFKLSIDRFGENSSFNMEHRKKIFRSIFDIFKTDIFKIVIDGEIKAVALAIIFKGVYVGLNMGYDYNVSNLGKFAIASSVERAIKLNCKVYDTGKGDNGYKERLKFDMHPQYKLEINLS